MTTEVLAFGNDRTPLDLLLFKRFGAETPGLVEATLSSNPGLAALGTCPPTGTRVTVEPPAPAPAPAATGVVRKTIRLYG